MLRLSQEINAIRPRRRVVLSSQVIARAGERVRARTRDGSSEVYLSREGALKLGRVLLILSRRRRWRGTWHGRVATSLGRAFIAAAKSALVTREDPS